MASPAEAIEKAKIGWQKLNINQKMTIVITTVAFLVALGTLLFWISRPSYSVLFSNLSPEDASAIVSKLQEKKIPYVLDGTSIIKVPSDKVYETRIDLAGQGLPQGGTVGFEIFDQNNFGLSEFTQKVNYRRALEGELARTISQINEISGARVHLVVPEPSLYSEKENPATASVVIKPKAGAKLSGNQVQGIVNLVARSVEGLKPENITVVDTNGNVLNEATGDSAMATQGVYTKTQLEAKEAYENSLEKSISSMLGRVLGTENNAVVRVSAELDFTSKEIQTNKVEQGENPPIVSEQIEKETYSGEGAPPGGVAGLSSQVPGTSTNTTQGSTTYPGVTYGSGNSEYKSSKTTRNYDSTKITEHEVKPPGEVKKLSVAVVVNNDGSKPVRDETIEKLVSAAAGIDKGRGDVLTVSSVPFDTEWAKKEESAIADAQRKEAYANYAKYAVVLILLAVSLYVLFRMASGFRSTRRTGDFAGSFSAGSIASVGEIDITAAEVEAEMSDLPPEKRKELLIRQRRRQMQREEIQNLAKERPADVAQLLRVWLNT
ncbi:MAG: flagellar M-ring protein FliF [Firmicutes bacterium]|nr:flagellar M-ring protein FliF [Bacillota bacterium]